MKQKLLKKSLLLFLSGIIIVSCTLEKDALEEHEHRKLTEQRISLYEIPGLQSKINARIQANKSMNRGGEIDYLELLNPDNVLLIEEENGNKHYTFSLNMQENNTLTNVVIKQVGTEIDYKVIEYASPDIEQWLIDNIDNGYSTITPTITQKGDGNDCLLFDARCPDPDFRHQLSDGECTYDASEFIITIIPVPCGPGSEGGNFDHFDDVGDGSSNTGSPSDNNYGSGGNNNTTFTNPNPPCDPRVDCPLFVDENPCNKIKNGTNSTAYKTKFKDLNTPTNYNKSHETGFFLVGNDYVDGTPHPVKNSILIPNNSKNGTHIHNNIIKTYSGTTTTYDSSIKMLSVGDVEALIEHIQPQNTDPKDAFVVMASNEGLFSISILESIPWTDELEAKLKEFEDYYVDRCDYIVDNYTTMTALQRKNFLEKMFLKGLSKYGLENKVGLFEGEVENETDPNINNYNIKWTRKTLKKVFLGYNVQASPCD